MGASLPEPHLIIHSAVATDEDLSDREGSDEKLLGRRRPSDPPVGHPLQGRIPYVPHVKRRCVRSRPSIASVAKAFTGPYSNAI
jgi:hypothetical protein